MIYIFELTPMGAVRMTQSDKWKTNPHHPDPRKRQRECVTRYFQFKRDLEMLVLKNKYPNPLSFQIKFNMPFPKSYSQKKRAELDTKPHTEKPDLDNMEKGFTDALYPSDKEIWHMNGYKFWTSDTFGWIEVEV